MKSKTYQNLILKIIELLKSLKIKQMMKSKYFHLQMIFDSKNG